MSAVFADTGYWIALLNSADGLHSKALALADSLWRRPVVTTDLVLVELLNYFAEQGEYCRSMAAALVSEINANPKITVIAFTADLFARAFDRYQKRMDKGWSFGDCVSFVVMEQRSIAEALATTFTSSRRVFERCSGIRPQSKRR
jgi:uncharacterized protein